jgi:hypothetical protein
MIMYNNIAKTCSRYIVSQSITRDGSGKRKASWAWGPGGWPGSALLCALMLHEEVLVEGSPRLPPTLPAHASA